jgi:hypothetical protein
LAELGHQPRLRRPSDQEIMACLLTGRRAQEREFA